MHYVSSYSPPLFTSHFLSLLSHFSSKSLLFLFISHDSLFLLFKFHTYNKAYDIERLHIYVITFVSFQFDENYFSDQRYFGSSVYYYYFPLEHKVMRFHYKDFIHICNYTVPLFTTLW